MIDFLRGIEGKTVASATLELEDGSTCRHVAVLTFTDGSRVMFEADIDHGVQFAATLTQENDDG